MMKRGEDLELDTMLKGMEFDDRGIRTLCNNGTSLVSVSGKFNPYKNSDKIDTKILKKQAQTILDSITMYDYTLDKSGE